MQGFGFQRSSCEMVGFGGSGATESKGMAANGDTDSPPLRLVTAYVWAPERGKDNQPPATLCRTSLRYSRGARPVQRLKAKVNGAVLA